MRQLLSSKRNTREWVSCFNDQQLAVVGSREGIEVHIWSNALSGRYVVFCEMRGVFC